MNEKINLVVENEDNVTLGGKIKKFVKEHKLEIALVGVTAVGVAAAAGYWIYKTNKMGKEFCEYTNKYNKMFDSNELRTAADTTIRGIDMCTNKPLVNGLIRDDNDEVYKKAFDSLAKIAMNVSNTDVIRYGDTAQAIIPSVDAIKSIIIVSDMPKLDLPSINL